MLGGRRHHIEYTTVGWRLQFPSLAVSVWNESVTQAFLQPDMHALFKAHPLKIRVDIALQADSVFGSHTGGRPRQLLHKHPNQPQGAQCKSG
jgi:hypothetical protein